MADAQTFLRNLGGWLPASYTWVYASADSPTFTFTVAGVDLTAVYTVGMRVRLAQTTGGTKYFIVTKVAFSTDTTVTIYGGTDYTLNNETISSPFISREKAPVGMPMDSAKWTVKVTDTSNRSQASPVAGTWYNPGTITISIPIGSWTVRYNAQAGAVDAAAVTGIGFNTTLSTANNTESDKEFSSFGQVNGITFSTDYYFMCVREKILVVTVKTSYFLNIKSGFTVDSIQIRGDIATTVIEAVCNYL